MLVERQVHVHIIMTFLLRNHDILIQHPLVLVFTVLKRDQEVEQLHNYQDRSLNQVDQVCLAF